MSRFNNLLSTLPNGAGKERILTALNESDIADQDYLRCIVAGNTKAEATALLQRNLTLSELDASALAGLLVAPTGQACAGGGGQGPSQSGGGGTRSRYNGIYTTGTLPIRQTSDHGRFVANDDDNIDAPLRGLAARNDACIKVAVTIFHSQSGVRKEICHFLCRNGFRHGMVKREDNISVQVVIVIPSGIQVNMTILSEYFGGTWNVTQDYFHIDRLCREPYMVDLLSKPFALLKSTVEDPQNASDEDFDMYSSDDGGFEIRSAGSIDF